MHIQEQISLKQYNTFGMDVTARWFAELNTQEDLLVLSDEKKGQAETLVLGGGSNILLTRPVDGLVIRNSLKGIEVAEENEDHIWIQVMAGEVWHDFVMYAVSHNLGGVENLSLIPGCVGASPMQNIGAYGVEVKDVIDEVVVWHWEERKFIVLKNADCHFGYRDSIFKQELKGKVLITAVTVRLDKKPVLNTSYGAIQQELENMGVTTPSIKTVSDAVIAIRKSKLPDPLKIGNAGSFFKNPTIPATQFSQLKQHYPALPSYPAGEGSVKIPAGWLIEQCGWKGYRNGDAGVHEKQALVLVNYGKANGNDIWALSEEVVQAIKSRFGIELEREVQVW